MAEVRYRVGTVGGQVAKKPSLREPSMLEKLNEILARDAGRWQIRTRGEREWSRRQSKSDTALELAELARQGDVGGAWQFRPASTPAALYVIRKIEFAPPVESPSVGSSAIKTIHVAYFKRFPDDESWGVFNCRPIAGSSSWSQHAWGNAEDFSDGGVASEEAEAWFFANRTKLPIAELIGRRKIWSKARATEGWRSLSSSANQHLDHWHVSGDELQTGTPPCAP